jgi:hypothetical protein
MDEKIMKKRVHNLECELSSLSRMLTLFSWFSSCMADADVQFEYKILSLAT